MPGRYRLGCCLLLLLPSAAAKAEGQTPSKERPALTGLGGIMSREKAATPVRVSHAEGIFVIDNGLVEVRFDMAKGTFTASAGGTVFVRAGRLSAEGGVADQIKVLDKPGPGLGFGGGVELKYPDGSADRLLLFPGLPFICVRPRLHNAALEPKIVGKITPASVTVDIARPPGELRVLGCDGLTGADRSRTSHFFLAMADTETRAGVVAGWLTHDRGSGVVLSEPEGGAVRFSGRCEYGKLRIAPGKTAEGETFAIGYFKDALDGLEALADAIARANRVKLRPVTSGYCTWYHARALNEDKMAELAEFCSKNLTKFGFAALQIDDGWQISGRDFTAHNPRGSYRSGMTRTAENITSAGMAAGIWYIPFGWDPKRPAFNGHQDWFVKRQGGGLYAVKWAGTCLDMTHPEAREFLRGVVARMSKEWGYKYIKIDGLWTGLAAKITYPNPAYRDEGLGDAVFHDPAKTNLDAYRDGLKLVREAAGDDVFILGCNIAQNMRTLGGSFGLVDGMRVGRDIGANWRKIIPSAEMGTRLYFLHGRVWYNDPDCLMLRKPMTLAQARAWGSWIAVSGQLNLVSEWLPGLPPERLEVVKRSMPNHGLCGRPLDLFERRMARVWHLASGEGESRRDVLGLFNWEGKPATVNVELAKLSLPGGGKGRYVGFDYWANRFVPPFEGELVSDLAPSSCRVIALRPMLDRPQVVSTSRHITQGVIDLKREGWDGKALSGTSLVVAADPYELRIVSPKHTAVSARVSAADRAAGVSAEFKQSGPCVRVTVKSAASREVEWKVAFKPGAAKASGPPEITGLKAEARLPGQVLLTWDDAEATYCITRSDGERFSASANRFVDTTATPGSVYRYKVQAVAWTAETSEGAEVEIRAPEKATAPPVPPKPDVHLSDLKPRKATVGWGKVHTNRSVAGKTLTVNGRKYQNGMGVHATSELVYDCKVDYRRFVAVAGIDHSQRHDERPSVVFKVYADGKLLAESPVLKWDTIDHWHFDCGVPRGYRRIRLVVTDAGDGNACDHADWVDAGFVTGGE